MNKIDCNQESEALHGSARERSSRSHVERLSRLLSAALDASSEGILIVDSRLDVVFHNRSAERAFSAVARGAWERLIISCPADRAAMQSAVVAAVDAGRVTALKLHDEKGATPAFCRVLPLTDERSRGCAVQRRLALIVCRAAAVAPEQVRAVCELYGLSHAECRVVELLAGGAKPQEIANALGCSIHTVRAHLKQIFYKSNTARQSEFIALVRTAVP